MSQYRESIISLVNKVLTAKHIEQKANISLKNAKSPVLFIMV